MTTLTCLVASIWLAACGVDDDNGPSDDMAELGTIVNLGLPKATGKWEIFTTPEAGGMLPGPTDSINLVAELRIDGVDVPKADVNTAEQLRWPAPNANRKWLSAPFKTLLTPADPGGFDIVKAQCEPFTAEVTKSKRKVPGIRCRRADTMLVYVLLQDLNEHEEN